MSGLRVALICDYVEEGWHSMDLLGEILPSALQASTSSSSRAIDVSRIRPALSQRFSRLFAAGSNADRLWGRFLDYPALLRPQRHSFDLFHILDHSYSQVLHVLPAGRCVVTCHDLDTFRSILEPQREPRPLWFRLMTGRILDGFRRARHVICVSNTVRDEVLRFGLHPPERLSVIPNGVHPTCSPDPDPACDAAARELLGPAAAPESQHVLHVGSTIARKNIPALLRAFAALRKSMPHLWLIRAGGGLAPEQQELADTLGVRSHIRILPVLERDGLAAVYRASPIVVMPSLAEGFGLPVVEAMACGCVVLANDIPVLREVGGGAAVFADASRPETFADALSTLLHENRAAPESWKQRIGRSLCHASGYSWQANAAATARLYHHLHP